MIIPLPVWRLLVLVVGVDGIVALVVGVWSRKKRFHRGDGEVPQRIVFLCVTVRSINYATISRKFCSDWVLCGVVGDGRPGDYFYIYVYRK